MYKNGKNPTLRDAIHNLPGYFESRSQTSGERGREVDGHRSLCVDHKITKQKKTESLVT